MEVVRKAIPEVNLWVAVIDQAIEDLRSPNRREAAIRWLVSDERRPASFRWACDHLDLNPNTGACRHTQSSADAAPESPGK